MPEFVTYTMKLNADDSMTIRLSAIDPAGVILPDRSPIQLLEFLEGNELLNTETVLANDRYTATLNEDQNEYLFLPNKPGTYYMAVRWWDDSGQRWRGINLALVVNQPDASDAMIVPHTANPPAIINGTGAQIVYLGEAGALTFDCVGVFNDQQATLAGPVTWNIDEPASGTARFDPVPGSTTMVKVTGLGSGSFTLRAETTLMNGTIIYKSKEFFVSGGIDRVVENVTINSNLQP